MKTILPIGSVVKINGINKTIMIFGFLQKSGVGRTDIVDYIGVPFPEGNIGAYSQIGFQREDIQEVIFEGYSPKEFEPFAQLMEEYGKKKNNEANKEEN